MSHHSFQNDDIRFFLALLSGWLTPGSSSAIINFIPPIGCFRTGFVGELTRLH
jgi:hypothetical protein